MIINFMEEFCVIEKKMNQYIKEMGEEYKKQRGNKRKLQKFETLEEEI